MSVEDLGKAATLFVDEDWKGRVEEEKKVAAAKSAPESSPVAAGQPAAEPPQVAEPRPSASDTRERAAAGDVVVLGHDAGDAGDGFAGPGAESVQRQYRDSFARGSAFHRHADDARSKDGRAAPWPEESLLDSRRINCVMAYIEAMSEEKSGKPPETASVPFRAWSSAMALASCPERYWRASSAQNPNSPGNSPWPILRTGKTITAPAIPRGTPAGRRAN